MKLQEIYELAIETGIKADPRGEAGIKKALEKAKKDYDSLSEKKKQYFDQEGLKNPYSDSRILYGDPKTEVDKILAGIDIDVGEVLLADKLRDKQGVDLVWGHHPHGAALAALDEVMDIQVDLLEKEGVPVNVAEGVLRERIEEVKRKLGPHNHYQSVDAARLLDMPFMVVHTITDNLAHKFMSEMVEKTKPQTVGDIMEMLETIPEYQLAMKAGVPPMVVSGSERNRAGKVAVLGFTGGTEGSKEIYERLSQTGIGTSIDMHLGEEHLKEARKHHINIVVAGHMVSDSLGTNLLLDELEKRGVQIIPCSGLIRVSRVVNK
jgi:putative NIF3 family GTP cyclohydrolase 1 type 2